VALRFPLPARSILVLVVALVFPSFAQIQPSVPNQPGLGPRVRSLEGKVLSKSGSPVPNAIVLLKDTKTLQVRSFIAQQDGKYHFYGLSPDINYQVRAEADDLTSPTKNISVFDSRSKIVVNLKLKKKLKKA
jgi:hypothetical protein